jgi:hypothetical protein
MQKNEFEGNELFGQVSLRWPTKLEKRVIYIFAQGVADSNVTWEASSDGRALA